MEHFKNLIEIQSLMKKISTHNENIKSHENRVLFVEATRKKRSDARDNLLNDKENIVKETNLLEKELYAKEKDLNRANENLTKASNQTQMEALEKEISIFSPAIDEIQEKILSNLENLENLEIEIQTADEFLKGSLETIAELKNEVQSDVELENKEIKNYQSRIDSLLSLLEHNHRDFFEQTLKNIKDDQVVSFLNGRICSRCRYEASSTQVTEIENGRSLEVCNNCSRILIPKTINSF